MSEGTGIEKEKGQVDSYDSRSAASMEGDHDGSEFGATASAINDTRLKDLTHLQPSPDDTRPKDPFSIQQEIDLETWRKERAMEDSLHRRQVELNIRSEMLKATNIDSERKRLDDSHEKFTQLFSQVDTISEVIDDFIEENPHQELGSSMSDIDQIISKVEGMRSEFRSIHKELRIFCGEQRYNDDQFSNQYKEKLIEIKEYLTNVRGVRKQIRELEDKARLNSHIAHGKKLKFLGTEVRRIITHLQNKFEISLGDEDDEEIKKRKEELSDDLKSFITIPKKIQEIMNEGETDNEVNEIRKLYNDLFDTRMCMCSIWTRSSREEKSRRISTVQH